MATIHVDVVSAEEAIFSGKHIGNMFLNGLDANAQLTSNLLVEFTLGNQP